MTHVHSAALSKHDGSSLEVSKFVAVENEAIAVFVRVPEVCE